MIHLFTYLNSLESMVFSGVILLGPTLECAGYNFSLVYFVSRVPFISQDLRWSASRYVRRYSCDAISHSSRYHYVLGFVENCGLCMRNSPTFSWINNLSTNIRASERIVTCDTYSRGIIPVFNKVEKTRNEICKAFCLVGNDSYVIPWTCIHRCTEF